MICIYNIFKKHFGGILCINILIKQSHGVVPTSMCILYNNCYYIGSEENPYLVCVGASSSNGTTVTLHPDTKIIAESAFRSVKTVVMYPSVTHIGARLFEGAGTIKYIGTATDWDAIDKSENWYLSYYTWHSTRSSVVYNYEP